MNPKNPEHQKRPMSDADVRANAAASENPMEYMYNLHDTPEWRSRFKKMSGAFMQKMGVDELERVKEIDPEKYKGLMQQAEFILTKFPEELLTFAETNEDLGSLLVEFGTSPKWFAMAAARKFNLSYDALYRSRISSPIRPFIGDFTVRPQKNKPYWQPPAPRPRITESSDVDITGIRTSFHIEQDFNDYSKDPVGYLQRMRQKALQEKDPKLKPVWEGVYRSYQRVQKMTFPRLKTQLFDEFGEPRRDTYGNEVMFPSSHQKAAIAKAIDEANLADYDDMGSGKTGIGIGLVEELRKMGELEHAIVVSPAGVKDSWESKLNEYYVKPPTIARIEGKVDLEQAKDALYSLVSYEYVAGRKPLPREQYDLAILDEAQYMNNDNNRARAVLELVKKCKRILILTGTPVRNSDQDLAHFNHMLDPKEFPEPNTLRQMGPAHASRTAEVMANKTIRRKTSDLVDLPPFCPETNGEIWFQQLKLNPTHQAVYDAIFEDYGRDQFSKIRLLRLASIDHNLVMGKLPMREFDEKDAYDAVERAHKIWTRTQKRGENIPFNSDFLANYGFSTTFTDLHFQYRRGVNEFIQRFGSTDMQRDWQGVRISTKFEEITKTTTESLAKGKKVLIFISGKYVEGVIREQIDEDGELIMEDLYSYMRKTFPDVSIGRIDGKVDTTARKGSESPRELERQRWHRNPNHKIELVSAKAASLGIDMTVNDGVTTAVQLIGPDLSDTYSDTSQTIKRVHRFGQLKPVHVKILEGKGTIDEGQRDLIMRKKDIADMLLDGVSLTDLEKQILESSKDKGALTKYITSPKVELERRLYSMKGRGETANAEYLSTPLEDGKTVGQAIAELYTKYWEYTYSGHTARLIRQVLDGLQEGMGMALDTVADLGCGPLVLERIMRQESTFGEKMRFVNIDMNPHMLQQGLQELEKFGLSTNPERALARKMSRTGLPDARCKAIICSLAAHYSKSDDDRGAHMTEINRIAEEGAYYIETLPHGYVAPDQFLARCARMEDFGFAVEKSLSGKARATDHTDVPYEVWLLVARKVGKPIRDDLPMEDFHFSFEAPKVSRYTGGQKKGGEQRMNGTQERLVKHEKFAILDPEKSFATKSSGNKGLAEYAEEVARNRGWQVSTRKEKDGTIHTVFKR